MIRVAVIGVGHMGTLHLQKWCRHEGVRVVGIYDIDRERLQRRAAEYGVRAFRELEELLAAADAVTIATPSRTHAALASQALDAGCHCLVEKPLAVSAAEAEELVRKARQQGRVLMAGHVERFNAAFSWLQQQAVAPRFVEIHRLHPFRPRSTDVSVVLDVMIHDLDLLLALLQRPVEHFEVHGVAVLTSMPDIANARLRFADGCIANVTASRISAKFLRKMRLFQASSYVAVDFAEQSVEQVVMRWGSHTLAEGEEYLAEWVAEDGLRRMIVRRRCLVPAGDPLWEEQRAFVRSILGEAPPAIPSEQTLEVLRLAEQIEQQLRLLSV